MPVDSIPSSGVFSPNDFDLFELLTVDFPPTTPISTPTSTSTSTSAAYSEHVSTVLSIVEHTDALKARQYHLRGSEYLASIGHFPRRRPYGFLHLPPPPPEDFSAEDEQGGGTVLTSLLSLVRRPQWTVQLSVQQRHVKEKVGKEEEVVLDDDKVGRRGGSRFSGGVLARGRRGGGGATVVFGEWPVGGDDASWESIDERLSTEHGHMHGSWNRHRRHSSPNLSPGLHSHTSHSHHSHSRPVNESSILPFSAYNDHDDYHHDHTLPISSFTPAAHPTSTHVGPSTTASSYENMKKQSATASSVLDDVKGLFLREPVYTDPWDFYSDSSMRKYLKEHVHDDDPDGENEDGMQYSKKMLNIGTGTGTGGRGTGMGGGGGGGGGGDADEGGGVIKKTLGMVQLLNVSQDEL